MERLWLDGNQIQYITQDDDSALKVLTNLEELHLQDNHIQVVFDLQLKLMQSLEWVSLENNPLVSAGCSGINFERRCIPPDSACDSRRRRLHVFGHLLSFLVCLNGLNHVTLLYSITVDQFQFLTIEGVIFLFTRPTLTSRF